ncbi:MAG: hypothetical protein IT168_28535 [Bryobacterales bacterium]|nr:hypothetical protein [Bryobacterales bacterium]
MSDYMFMLESHLSNEQNDAVSVIEAAAGEAGARVFLSGGAMRDMLGGFPIRDLDFTVDGDTGGLIKALVANTGAQVLWAEENRKATSVRLENGLVVEIRAAHIARYAKPGGKPQIQPAGIHEDLRGRDFTINSIALSLNFGSRGLLLDPTNGLADLERRELRADSNYSLYDDPSRVLRLFRLQARLGFSLDPRTQQQYENVREARLEAKIPARVLLAELHRMADEPNPVQLLELLERERLLTLFSPALTGAKLNLAGFARLEKIRQTLPYDVELPVDNFGLFCLVLTEKLTPKERSAMAQQLDMSTAEIDRWQKLEARSRRLETLLKAANLKRASLVYKTLRSQPGELVLLLLLRSGQRLVHDRIKNYLFRYAPAANEVRDRDLDDLKLNPGSPEFRRAKDELIFSRLDARVRKAAPVEGEEVTEAVPVPTPGLRR